MSEWVFWMNCSIALIWGIHWRSQLQQPLFQRGFTNTNNVLFRLMQTSAWQRWACWSDRCLHLLSILSRAQSWPYVAVTPWSHPSSLAAAALSETQRRPTVHVCLRVGSSQKQSLKKKSNSLWICPLCFSQFSQTCKKSLFQLRRQQTSMTVFSNYFLEFFLSQR